MKSIIGWLGGGGAIIGILAIVINFYHPELRCKLGLGSEDCAEIKVREIDLLIRSETNEALSEVKIEIIGHGATETLYSDSNGLIKAKIPVVGDVHVILSKTGYKTQETIINSNASQDTVRVIRFEKSGKPEVVPLPNIQVAQQLDLLPKNLSHANKSEQLSDTLLEVTKNETSSTKNLDTPKTSVFENEYIRAYAKGASFYNSDGGAQVNLIIENKTDKDLYLAVEYNEASVFNDFGENSKCNVNGIANLQLGTNPGQLSFTVISPKTNINVSMFDCNHLIGKSNSSKNLSINMTIDRLDNEKENNSRFSRFSLNLNDIPISSH